MWSQQDDPQGMFEDLLRDNAELAAQADEQLAAFPDQAFMSLKPDPATATGSGDIKGPDVAISIVSLSRALPDYDIQQSGYPTRYLVQIVAKIMESLMNDQSNLTYKLLLCNVDSDPENHEELIEISPRFTVLTKYRSVDKKDPRELNIFNKEKEDSVYCMKETLARVKPRYILMLEDDAIPRGSVISRLEHLIRFHLDRTSKRTTSASNVAYVKLFHPPHLNGYLNPNLQKCLELLGFSAFFGTILYNVLRILCMRSITSYKCTDWFLAMLYCGLLAVAIGRVYIIELLRFGNSLYGLASAPDCCTQAVLFSNQSALDIAGYLESVECIRGFAKDTAMEQYVRDHELQAYLLEPNLFRHVGVFSSLHEKIMDPKLFLP